MDSRFSIQELIAESVRPLRTAHLESCRNTPAALHFADSMGGACQTISPGPAPSQAREYIVAANGNARKQTGLISPVAYKPCETGCPAMYGSDPEKGEEPTCDHVRGPMGAQEYPAHTDAEHDCCRQYPRRPLPNSPWRRPQNKQRGYEEHGKDSMTAWEACRCKLL